ncbi:RCC1 domain-containing protein [Acidipropionibacterium timonense]|uniref:RCC1 domain-containing protein n=1 Tax=Acidipropionibacterium timonense TaxID=2161818 RepID=UPI0010307202|nr:hypothetical protein [Acidipropionibacterium timonense]
MRTMRHVLGAVAAAALLATASGQAAAAAPTPGTGPEAGGTTVSLENPVDVSFRHVSVGGGFMLALDSHGRVWGWGNNAAGQLGNGTRNTMPTRPVMATMPEGQTFSQVDAGKDHALGLTTSGSVMAWGNNHFGERGVPAAYKDGLIPRPVTTVGGSSISAGERHSLLAGSDGAAWAWGRGTSGELGQGISMNPNNGDSRVPLKVVGSDGLHVKQVSAGQVHSVALDSTGSAWAWGFNDSGALGDGTAATRYSATKVKQGDVKFTQISAGMAFSMAVSTTGDLYGWGTNWRGQLGDGTKKKKHEVPVRVEAPAGVTFSKVSAGDAHTIALSTTGEIYGWGWNSFGQVGNDAPLSTNTPQKVVAPKGLTFTDVAAGGDSSAAVASDGSVYTWGHNDEGQLGNGTMKDSRVPVKAAMPTVTVTKVSFGGEAGTDLRQSGSTLSVVTPRHAPGKVDVTVDWTLDGVAQKPVVLADGFTFAAAPTPTVTPTPTPTDTPTHGRPTHPSTQPSASRPTTLPRTGC